VLSRSPGNRSLAQWIWARNNNAHCVVAFTHNIICVWFMTIPMTQYAIYILLGFISIIIYFSMLHDWFTLMSHVECLGRKFHMGLQYDWLITEVERSRFRSRFRWHVRHEILSVVCAFSDFLIFRPGDIPIVYFKSISAKHVAYVSNNWNTLPIWNRASCTHHSRLLLSSIYPPRF
jgi:hypothetical protein